jgi:hypothetical protein
MSNLGLYLRFELGYLLLFLLLIPTPLGCFYYYSEFKAPGLSYTLIAVLFVFQYFFFNQKTHQKKLWEPVSKMLERKQGKIPPQKIIHQITMQIVNFRIISITIISFVILILSAAFNRLTVF